MSAKTDSLGQADIVVDESLRDSSYAAYTGATRFCGTFAKNDYCGSLSTDRQTALHGEKVELLPSNKRHVHYTCELTNALGDGTAESTLSVLCRSL